MNEELRTASKQGDINHLYTLIQPYPNVLDNIDELPFVDTPLHIAAAAGRTPFALEIMRLKPSFAWKPNLNGFSPIHLALQNGERQTALRLVKVEKELVRVKGREGITPLHYVAKVGDVDLLSKFLEMCPDSIQDVTVHCETALHIAAKNDQLQALKYMVRWIKWSCDSNKIMKVKDDDGNTVLHIATSHNQIQAVKILLELSNEKNFEGLTALNIAEIEMQLHSNRAEIRNILMKAKVVENGLLSIILKSILKIYFLFPYITDLLIAIEKTMIKIKENHRSALLVVVGVMAAAIFQAGLNPPGGVWQDNYIPSDPSSNITSQSPPQHIAGQSETKPQIFVILSGYNSAALWGTVYVFWFLLPPGHANWWLLLPFCYMLIVYVTSLTVTAPDEFARHRSIIWFFALMIYVTCVKIQFNIVRSYRLSRLRMDQDLSLQI